MARFGRRKATGPDAAGGGGEVWPGDVEPARRRPAGSVTGRSGTGRSGTGRSGTGRSGTGRSGTGRSGTGRSAARSSAAGSSPAGGPAAGLPADDLPTTRLRGNEITYAYVVGALLVVAGVLMLVFTGGKGAPRHPQPLWPSLSVALGVATLVGIRFANRILTAITVFVGGFATGQAKTPTALAGVKVVALIAPVAFAILVFRRQSNADRARRAMLARQGGTGRQAGTGRRGRRGKGGEAAEPAGPVRPAPSGRYTPPKSRERRTRS